MSAANAGSAMNMDLWNNAVGRKYGKKTKNRLHLFKELLKALKSGELITNLSDKREYTGLLFLKTPSDGTVIVIGKDKRGRNILFFDLHEKRVFFAGGFCSPNSSRKMSTILRAGCKRCFDSSCQER
jgi:hypothetical protein